MTVREETPQHRAVKKCIAAYVRHYGLKQGIHLAAEAIGMGERAARHAHDGTYFAADEERAARADEARLFLAEQQLAQLRAEIEDVEGRRHVAMDGANTHGARSRVSLWRALVLRAGEVTA